MNKAGDEASNGHDEPESILVGKARAGDVESFRLLYEKTHRRLFAAAVGIVRNRDDAMDIVQDAFIKAHRNLATFQGGSTFYTWVYRIMMNLSIDHLRKQRRHQLDATAVPLDGDPVLAPRLMSGNPVRAALDSEIRERMNHALSALSENHRAVLVMRELDGLSYDEMADVMGCSKGTIMSRLFHARKYMQAELADLAPGQSDQLEKEQHED